MAAYGMFNRKLPYEELMCRLPKLHSPEPRHIIYF